MRRLLMIAILAAVAATVGTALADPPTENATDTMDTAQPAAEATPATPPAAAVALPGDPAPTGEVSAAVAPELPPVEEAVSGLKLALQNAHWLVALGFALILLVYFLRLGLAPLSEWFKSRLGGWVLLCFTSVVGVVGVGLSQGMALSWSLILAALTIGLLATAIRKAVRDPSRPPRVAPS